ncbi:glycosyltransferase family 2 protein [Shewanella woodyi]|uniref:glycosyltransferase family 2 protein n=1 Tax=Shewanella woodyi TaxID=60961 RepID=UPI00374A7790
MLTSIIIPCYNEVENLPLLVERCRQAIRHSKLEFIIVDNGSTDDTSKQLAELISADQFIHACHVQVNQGYGFGICAGLKIAQGDILGWTHADLQTDPYDTVNASSVFEYSDTPEILFVKGTRKKRPLKDNIFTIGMSICELFLHQIWLWDINAQPTLFHRKFYESWQSPPNDFSLDLYAFFLAKKSHKIKRIPVTFSDRKYGQSNWNINWRQKLKFIKRTLDFSLSLKKR